MRAKKNILILVFICIALADGLASAESVVITASHVTSSLMRRVIKKFDFNERSLGNLEDVPMYWTKVRAEGFPHFVNGKLDEQVGVPPPSFRLQLNGGNLGYLFLARKISAFPGSDHKIIAKVKTANMKYSRGYIEAFYLDRFGNPLKDTIRYSQLISPKRDNNQGWQTITVNLPFSNSEGRFIGLGVFLVQPDHFPKRFGSQIVSYKKDIFATMWIDEIAIIRLPQVRLQTENNRFVYDTAEEINILSLVADPCAKDIRARMLLIDSASGKAVKWNIPIEILPPIEAILQGEAQMPEFCKFSLGTLKAGLYTVRLDVLANKERIITKSTDFVVVNHNRPHWSKNGLGIDLSDKILDNPERISEFVSKVRPGWILIPFWRHDLKCVSADSLHSNPDIIVSKLKRDEIKIFGGFPSIPKDIKLTEKLISPTIWDLFASKSQAWKIPLATLLARHADRIDSWVFGRVNHYWQEPDIRIASLLSKVRKYFCQFQGESEFIVDWPAMCNPPDRKIADNYLLRIPVELVPSSFENYFVHWKQRNYAPLVILQTQNLKKYETVPAVLDFVKRVIEARRNGISLLAVDTLWGKQNQTDRLGMMIPNAYYPAYANVIDRLGSTDYMGQIKISARSKGLLFGNAQHAVLVICGKGHKENEYIKGTISLGTKLKVYDMWGRSLPMIYDENDNWLVPYRPVVFIDGISSELAYFISTIRFAQPNLTSKFGVHRVKLMFKNTFGQTITGTVRVKASRFWHFDPSGARFTLVPGGAFVLPMKLRFPSNEPIGQKVINVTFDLEAKKFVHLNLLVPLGVSPSDLKMRVLWFMRNDKLVVLQEIRNYGKVGADLKAFLIAPNRPRMERQIRKLMPGQFAIKEYVVGSWRQMFGKKIRVGFREIRGTRMVNEIITVE